MLGLLLLCDPVHAARPYETRTAWVGGSYWVGAGTGNTVDFTGGKDYHSNAVWLKNDFGNVQATMNYCFINLNAANISTHTVDTALFDKRSGYPSFATGSSALRYPTTIQASASTSDFFLKAGESIWLDPWICSRIEVTANTIGDDAKPKGQGGYLRVLGLIEY